MCVSTLPLGRIPFSLFNMARKSTSVFTKPFISASARPSRTSSTAFSEASCGSLAKRVSYFPLNFSAVSWEQTNIGLITPALCAISTASRVWLSSAHTTATLFLMPLSFRFSTNWEKSVMLFVLFFILYMYILCESINLLFSATKIQKRYLFNKIHFL